MTKFCSRCRTEKPTSAFYTRRADTTRNKAGELLGWCKDCRRELKHLWARDNPEKIIAYRRKQYIDHHEELALKARVDRQELKRKVIEHYSSGSMKCLECGIDDIIVLCIDHINGNGQEHRRSINRTSGAGFYQWLIQNDYPDGFQVLCYNCNMRKRWNQQEYGVKNGK